MILGPTVEVEIIVVIVIAAVLACGLAIVVAWLSMIKFRLCSGTRIHKTDNTTLQTVASEIDAPSEK